MTEFFLNFLPIIIYILLIILLVIGIILGIRLIGAMDKLDNLINNVEGKVNSLNGLFGIIDFTTDKISSITDKIVETFTNLISNIGKKRESKDLLEEDDYE